MTKELLKGQQEIHLCCYTISLLEEVGKKLLLENLVSYPFIVFRVCVFMFMRVHVVGGVSTVFDTFYCTSLFLAEINLRSYISIF
jgi:hypothetical protein